jgi:hypothetical protein
VTTELHKKRAAIGEPVRARLEKTAIRPEAVARGEDSVGWLGAQVGIVDLEAEPLGQVWQVRHDEVEHSRHGLEQISPDHADAGTEPVASDVRAR